MYVCMYVCTYVCMYEVCLVDVGRSERVQVWQIYGPWLFTPSAGL